MIIDKLSVEYQTYCFWNEADKRSWKRPALFDAQAELEEGRIYLAPTDALPSRHEFTSDYFIICVGDEPRKNYLRGCFPFIWVKNGYFAEVFNKVQGWYESYAQWEIDMQEVIASDIDFGKLTKLSLPFIGNPVAILDTEFYHVAITTWEKKADGQVKFHVEAPMFPISLEKFENVHTIREKYKELRGIYRPTEGYICSNLFVTGRFVGTITVAERWRPFRKSDEEIIQVYAERIEEAFLRRASVKTMQTSTLKSVVFDYLNKNPVSKYRVAHITTENQFFLCFKVMVQGDGHLSPPVNYICSILENMFEGCVAMEYEGCIMGIVDFSIFPYELEKFIATLKSFLDKKGFYAGVSDRFTDIQEVWIYHRQAYHAFRIGQEMHPEKRIYFFMDYAFIYMLENCTGEFSLKHLIPPELRTLLKSSKAGVNYAETLKCYLENNMNASVTSRLLYLHRSSFMNRMERVHQILGDELLNSKTRLWYQILLTIYEDSEENPE
ncbi:PucR C-terminal helix-turn-helix domain-containing protein [Lactonifactor longoviformis DSM 17459]|uniref:PucR C-terminal helix-turn-helix domain-containing protein n=2 Tax=Lactonifactor TaxID=420345 RepID=A0A1M4ZYP0_9CLOT|nr:PucR C-terminal helix-turn-helix domain-containing protein [Lactonifactor longoviformis DSM 17459]